MKSSLSKVLAKQVSRFHLKTLGYSAFVMLLGINTFVRCRSMISSRQECFNGTSSNLITINNHHFHSAQSTGSKDQEERKGIHLISQNFKKNCRLGGRNDPGPDESRGNSLCKRTEIYSLQVHTFIPHIVRMVHYKFMHGRK